METIRINQGLRSPFNPFNILYTEILLPCNQGTVIFSNFAELTGVSLAPPWVLNSYSATHGGASPDLRHGEITVLACEVVKSGYMSALMYT